MAKKKFVGPRSIFIETPLPDPNVTKVRHQARKDLPFKCSDTICSHGPLADPTDFDWARAIVQAVGDAVSPTPPAQGCTEGVQHNNKWCFEAAHGNEIPTAFGCNAVAARCHARLVVWVKYKAAADPEFGSVVFLGQCDTTTECGDAKAGAAGKSKK